MNRSFKVAKVARRAMFVLPCLTSTCVKRGGKGTSWCGKVANTDDATRATTTAKVVLRDTIIIKRSSRRSEERSEDEARSTRRSGRVHSRTDDCGLTAVKAS
jgi:hypothetical protein